MSLAALDSLRNDESFDDFWKDVLNVLETNDIEEPFLPRKRKAPARYAIGTGEAHNPETAMDLYKLIFFAAIDTFSAGIKKRFEQPGYGIYSQLEGLLLKAAVGQKYDAELSVETTYSGDINITLLRMHTTLFVEELLQLSCWQHCRCEGIPAGFGRRQ